MLARIHGLAALSAACCLALALPKAPAAELNEKMVTATFQVADLVIPPNYLVQPNYIVTTQGGANATAQKQGQTQENELIQLITRTCSPRSWCDMGGAGTINYFPLTMTLVVNQTLDIQEQIADLFAALRRMQDLQVSLEVRMMTVSEGLFERLGVDFSVKGSSTLNFCQPNVVWGGYLQTKDEAEHFPMAFLNDKQLFQFMEAAQGDQRTNIMQAPKLTLFNGQASTLSITDNQAFLTGVDVSTSDGQVVIRPKNEPVTTGFRMTAQPVVSADRRSVRLSLKIEQTDLAPGSVPVVPVTVAAETSKEKAAPCTQFLQQPRFTKMAIDKTVVIPDGGTVVFGGLKKVVETREEYGPPILSKIPYVNRLFKNVGSGRETQQVFVLVTPRIIVNEEKEEVKAEGTVQRLSEQDKSLPSGCPHAITPAVYEEPGQIKSRELVGEKLTGPAKSEKSRQEKMLAKLRKAYDEACAGGHADEAKKYARAALAIDPTCFQRKR